MQNMEQYLKQKIQPFLHQLFSHYLPEVQFKEIHDLFNAQKFHQFLLCILTSQIKNKINDIQFSPDDDLNQSYEQIKIKAFLKISNIIQSGFYTLGMNFRQKISIKQIENMVKKNDFKILNCFLQYVNLDKMQIFELFVHNQELLLFITTLDEQIQTNIMQIVKNGELYSSNQDCQDHRSQHSINFLKVGSKIKYEGQNPHSLIQIQQLQTSLQIREEQIKQIKQEKYHLEEQNQELKRQISLKDKQLDQLRRRLQNCQNVELYLHENDQQLKQAKLKLKQNQSKYQSRLAELIQQIKEYEQKYKSIELNFSSKSSQMQKLKIQFQKLSKQKSESQNARNIVIANLKQKRIQAQFRVQQLQQELQVVKHNCMEKQRELISLKTSQAYHKQKSGYDAFSSPRSPLKGEQFMEGIESFRGNYSKLGEQIAFDLDRTDLQQDLQIITKSKTTPKYNEVLKQNYALKNQVRLLESSNLGDSKVNKELEAEVQKLKKKIVILKRRNDEIDNQRKEQADVMVGVIEQMYVNSCQNVPVVHNKLAM